MKNVYSFKTEYFSVYTEYKYIYLKSKYRSNHLLTISNLIKNTTKYAKTIEHRIKIEKKRGAISSSFLKQQQ